MLETTGVAASQGYEVGHIPQEILRRPRANVFLSGLNVDPANRVHYQIWQDFTVNRGPDRAPVHFSLINPDHILVAPKPKDATFEWYKERGIIKSYWLKKYTSDIPALVAHFVDLEWDDPEFSAKRDACVARIKEIRQSLQGRATRIALVLIQKNSPLPMGDNVIATERAAGLCALAEISDKQLLAISYADHLFGFILRLEAAFLELAKGFYQNEYRRVQKRHQLLIKGTHQLLYIRHQFKMGFFQEMKQEELPSAQQHYKMAYSHITEMKTTDQNMLEVKTVAAFINYKICELSFILNSPLDAIHQFRKHADFFKKKVGIPDLGFEHYAWMSKQFQYFGDIFDHAIQTTGLGPLQTQHPGFYHQQAALHAVQRRNAALELCRNATLYPDPDPLINRDNLPYFGQRPWRAAAARGEQPDVELEVRGIQALQYYERQVRHCDFSIPLFYSAISHFRKYNCPRMKRYLSMQLAEEYFVAEEYDKALGILTHIFKEYRLERWRPLVSQILIAAVKAAYLAASVEQFVFLGLNYIASYCIVSDESKHTVQAGVMNVIEGRIPSPPFVGIKDKSQAWSERLGTVIPAPLGFQLDKMIPFVDFKVHFSQQVVSYDQHVKLNVYVQSTCPQSFRASKLSLHFNHSSFDNQCIIDASSPLLHFVPKKTTCIPLTLRTEPLENDLELKVTAIVMELGNGAVTVSWNVGKTSAEHWNSNLAWSPIPTVHSNQDHVPFKDLPSREVCRLTARHSNIVVSVDHQAPLYLDEMHPMLVTVVSQEINELSNMKLSVRLNDSGDGTSLQSNVLFASEDSPDKLVANQLDIDLGMLGPASQKTHKVFVKSALAHSLNLMCKVVYNTRVEHADGDVKLCTCWKETSLCVEVHPPMDISCTVLSARELDPMTTVRVGEDFFLAIDITSKADVALELVQGRVEPSVAFLLQDEAPSTLINSIRFRKGDSVRDLVRLSLNEMDPLANAVPLIIGTYWVKWKRVPAGVVNVFKTSLSSNIVCADACDLRLYLDNPPALASLRTPLPITYVLDNVTKDRIHHIKVTMHATDAFMYAGNKEIRTRIGPGEKQKLSYNLYPLHSGFVRLPRLEVQEATMISGSITEPLGSSKRCSVGVSAQLPDHLFVMPRNNMLISDAVRAP